MKQNSTVWHYLSTSFILLILFFAGCGKDKPSDIAPEGKIKFAMLTMTGSFPNQTSYLSGFPNIDQKSYTNANAEEFAQGGLLWAYGAHAFVNLTGAPATMKKFGFDNGSNPVLVGELKVPGANTFSGMCFVSDTEAYVGVSASGNAFSIVRFNPTTMQKTGDIGLDPLKKEGIPTIYIQQIVKRAGKLFVGIAYEKNFEPVFNEVVVAIVDIASQKIEKSITDSRSSRIFHVGHTMSSLALSDNGDIYVAADGWTDKPSGILRIKNNEYDFDKGFFMDLDELTDAKCRMIALYGSNKALTMRMSDPTNEWEMKGPNYRYAKLDLSSKTYEGLVEELPLVFGPSSSFLKFVNGEWLLNAGGIANSSVYVFDPTTGSVKKKFDVERQLVGLVELK